MKLKEALAIADEKEELRRQEEANTIEQAMQDRIDFIDKLPVGTDRNGNIKWKILKTETNFQQVLDKHGINVTLDAITKEIKINKFEDLNEEDKGTKIKDICVREGLNFNENDVGRYIGLIARQNQVNEFVELVKLNQNDDQKIIKQVFNTLEINYDDSPFNEDLKEYYFEIFYRWALGLVRLSINSFANSYQSEGLLVLQGEQGKYKSTWCSKLMPNKKLFMGDVKLEPSNKDSLIQNTHYILVEVGELDDTVTKKETTALKRFLTAKIDEYRMPYGKCYMKVPRVTTFIGTVNNKHFLRDTTGNRRYFVIPVKSCDFKALEKIDICKFWGKIYNDLLNGEQHYLDEKFKEIQKAENLKYMAESDISIMLSESIDWESDFDSYEYLTITEICENLKVPTTNNTKKIKAELEKRGHVYKTYRTPTGLKKCFKIPPFKNV